jgi:hypothetical protein
MIRVYLRVSWRDRPSRAANTRSDTPSASPPGGCRKPTPGRGVRRRGGSRESYRTVQSGQSVPQGRLTVQVQRGRRGGSGAAGVGGDAEPHGRPPSGEDRAVGGPRGAAGPRGESGTEKPGLAWSGNAVGV